MRPETGGPGRLSRHRAALAVTVAGAAACAALLAPTVAAAARPNVILIQVDDMARSQMRAKIRERGRWQPAMPNLLRRVARRGVELDRYYASHPLCGPSRASLLSGRATHNHGMRINAAPYGYPVWREGASYGENLAVWLDRTGYRPAHVGKYMNGYGADLAEEVPPGWDRWVTPIREAGGGYYGVSLNVDGRVTPPIGEWKQRDRPGCRTVFYTQPGACLHSTDVYTGFALKELGRAAAERRPFFMQLDYNAPHDDGRLGPGPGPPARLKRLVGRVKPPARPPDAPIPAAAPWFIRRQEPLTGAMRAEIRARHANEVVALRAVDEGIGRILGKLARRGLARRTFVLFVSDNGMFHGEHRIAYGKYLPQEPSARQPLLARGPGIPPGRRSRSSGSNLDLAATVMAMAGARPGRPTDGRSLLGDLRHPRRVSRGPVLLEGFNGREPALPEPFLDGAGRQEPNQALVLQYTGLVAGRWKYVRYAYGDQELYDLERDPGELRNLAWRRDMAPIAAWGRAQAERLAGCSGGACRLPVAAPRRP